MTFIPAPLRTRHDGWTPERQAVFIEVLQQTRSATRAAAAAGMSRRTAYRLRERPGAAAFALAWDAAMAPPNLPMPENALTRALAGETEIIEDEGLPAIRTRQCATALLLRMLDRAAAYHARAVRKAQKNAPL